MGGDLTGSQPANWQKWVRIGLHGVVSAILLFILGLILEIKSKPVSVKISFWSAWQIYGVTNLILLSLVFGIIMALQKRRFFAKADSYFWLWPLIPMLVTLFPFVFYIGQDHLIFVYFIFWMAFAVFCLILTAINKGLQLLHKRKFA